MSSQNHSAAAAASVSTKPVHPVVLTSFAPTGCELSTWAFLTEPRPDPRSSTLTEPILPNLVVAHGNCLRIYAVDTHTGTLLLASTYDRLAGNIITLHTLPSAAGHGRPSNTKNDKSAAVEYDGLLIGFAGHPQISIVYPPHISSTLSSWTGVLSASSIVDLTPALTELSFGSVSALDCDMMCAVFDSKSYSPPLLNIPSMNNYSTKHSWASHLLHMNSTVAVILGGGIGVALFQLLPAHRSMPSDTSTSTCEKVSNGWWKIATKPYILPLPFLYQQLVNRASSASNLSSSHSSLAATTTASMATVSKSNKSITTATHGFGDILAVDFLQGLAEPTIVILHSNPNNGRGGLAWSGRMAHGSSSCRTPLTLTAISVSITQQRSVVLWTLKDMIPVDAWDLQAHPMNGCLVIGVNEVVYVDNCGRIKAALAVNGWVRATASSILLSKIQPASLETLGKNKDKDSSSLTFLYQKATKASSPSFMQPNPSPLPKLSIQLDGCRVVFVQDNTAIVALRDGSLFLLEIHHEKKTLSGARRLSDQPKPYVLSMAPTGRKLGSLGMISTLSYIPLLRLSGEQIRIPHIKAYDSIQNILLGTSKKEEHENDVINILQSKMQGTNQVTPFSMGLLFAGSRVGDSSFLVYGIKEDVPFLPWNDESPNSNNTDVSSPGSKRKNSTDANQPNSRAKKDYDNMNKDLAIDLSDDDGSLTEEDKMRREEEMLYAPPTETMTMNDGSGRSQTVSDDDDDQLDSSDTLLGIRNSFVSRPQIKSMCMLDSMQILDSLTGVGPIGPGCKGPLACSLRNPSDLFKTRLPGTQLTVVGSSTQIHPCGYNTSGGLAILHCPGMNHSSTILSEIDCKGVDSIFSSIGHIFLTLDTGGCLVLREAVQEESPRSYYKVESDTVPHGVDLVEVDISKWTDKHKHAFTGTEIKSTIDVQTLFTKGKVYMVSEHQFAPLFDKLSSVVLAYLEGKYIIAVLSISLSSGDTMKIDYHHILGSTSMVDMGALNSLSQIQSLDGNCADTFAVACVWENNILSIISISYDLNDWRVNEAILHPQIEDVAVGINDNEDDIAPFYESNKIVACDLFMASEDLFPVNEATFNSDMEDKNTESNIVAVNSSAYEKVISQDEMNLYDDDDAIELMPSCEPPVASFSQNDIAPCRYNTLGGYISGANLSHRRRSFLAVYYQSGKIDIFDLSTLTKSGQEKTAYHIPRDDIIAACVWSAQNSSFGVSCLSSENASQFAVPKFTKTHVSEAKLFFAGPSCVESVDRDLSLLRSLCLLIETSIGDLYMYTAKRSNNGKLELIRVPLSFVSRTSKEEMRHGTKLKRRKILKDTNTNNDSFRKARLHRFFSISGQDGLFAATSRPSWFVSERGAPYVLCHRLRYAAPAGGRALPIAGFCPNFKIKSNECRNNYFLTLHERIGRVGSQRLTIYSNLSDVFGSYGLLPGGNVAIEKIPLGVTVRKIVFIDDVSISSVTNPVYALLISREIDKDQSHLHDDGLHAIDRRVAKQEREKEKVRRQVEADLGGFDVEQEWVEDIERDDVFEVETRYGRAPTIPFRVYEVWLVNSAGWSVVDTYQLPEFEHGLALQVVRLSDVSSDVESNERSTETRVFLAVGTGIIDNDGEDVSSRGRILLFDVQATKNESFGAELDLVYDKDISMGPVTSLHTLDSQNCSRLLIGAGNEITVEQWGGGKLTQVGFFHCQMQVQEITVLKNFLLLSDALEGISFLVWRESDKSLTLLAKDYDPTIVFASGMISRGGSLSFISHDDRQNLQFFSYAPAEPAARGGNKLVCRADIHLGIQTLSLQNHLCRSSLIVNSANETSTIAALKLQDTFYGKGDDDVRFAVHYGTSDGGYGSIFPINENIYWRLTALQSVMSNALESDCALSHRSWRLYRRTTKRGSCKNNDRKKGVIDGDLVLKYSNMSISKQEDLASSVGTTVDLILDNLLEISCAAYVL